MNPSELRKSLLSVNKLTKFTDMGFISWIILGLIAGTISKKIVGGGAEGWIMTLLLGVLGAVVGGWLSATLLNINLGSFWNPVTWLIAILGGLLVTAIYNKLVGKKDN